jgi:hypothetical protein
MVLENENWEICPHSSWAAWPQSWGTLFIWNVGNCVLEDCLTYQGTQISLSTAVRTCNLANEVFCGWTFVNSELKVKGKVAPVSAMKAL